MRRLLLNDVTEMAITLVLLVFFVALSGVVYYRYPGPLTQATTVIVDAGSSSSQIASQLIDEGVIRGPAAFVLVVLSLTDQRHMLKAGEYEFFPGEPMISVVRKLVVGQVVIHKFTVVEGATSFQVLQDLAKAPHLVGDVPQEVPEGSLLPDTYFYNRGDTRSSLLMRMNLALKENLEEIWANRKQDLPKQIQSPTDIVILASIIEKETAVDVERERIAGVFVNRLKDGMPLQSDPTVLYALTQGRGGLDRRLTLNDLQNTKSPYNTYLVKGLPAGPICNPGLASLKAAAYPEENSFFYFVADGYGGHKFATNLTDHNRNVVEWRRIRRLLQTDKPDGEE